MPWAAVQTPSLAVVILKRCVQDAGFPVDVHLLNLRFAKRLGLKTYEGFSSSTLVAQEWFFSQMLFGPYGTAEMEGGWDSLSKTEEGRGVAQTLLEAAGGSEDLCRTLASQHVPEFLDECLEGTDWSRYVVVGFTVTFAQSLASLLLACRIKQRHPAVKIVLGGANVEGEMGAELLRGFPWVDFVISGEGEKAFPALLRRLAEGRPLSGVPGLLFRQIGEIAPECPPQPLADLNESPVPDYSDYVAELHRTALRRQLRLHLYFDSSRGCWWGAKHHCTFCGLNGNTMAFRAKPAESVYRELLELSERYHCLSFAATDNILSMTYFNDVLPRLAELDFDFSLFYEEKANLSKAQVVALRRAGVKSIQPGIESFDTRVLQLMNKGATGLQNIQLVKWCAEAQLDPLYNILYGFPGETAADYARQPELFRGLRHLQPPGALTSIMMERFSPYFFNRGAYGLTLPPSQAYSVVYPQNRVCLDRIAHFFDGHGETLPDSSTYMEPVRREWEVWKEAYTARRTICCYEKGPGHLLILDNRPKPGEDTTTLRHITLDGIAAAIYLFCDEARSVRAIREMLMRDYLAAWTESRIREWLTPMTSRGLMSADDDRYLSLAVRRSN